MDSSPTFLFDPVNLNEVSALIGFFPMSDDRLGHGVDVEWKDGTIPTVRVGLAQLPYDVAWHHMESVVNAGRDARSDWIEKGASAELARLGAQGAMDNWRTQILEPVVMEEVEDVPVDEQPSSTSDDLLRLPSDTLSSAPPSGDHSHLHSCDPSPPMDVCAVSPPHSLSSPRDASPSSPSLTIFSTLSHSPIFSDLSDTSSSSIPSPPITISNIVSDSDSPSDPFPIPLSLPVSSSLTVISLTVAPSTVSSSVSSPPFVIPSINVTPRYTTVVPDLIDLTTNNITTVPPVVDLTFQPFSLIEISTVPSPLVIPTVTPPSSPAPRVRILPPRSSGRPHPLYTGRGPKPRVERK